VGKSLAASLAANTFNAYYVEMKSAWTRKTLLSAILKDMGISEGRTMPVMLDQISEELALSGRPLIIDEFDYVVERNMINLVRDIYEGSNAAILIVGEEHLSNKILNKPDSERFHNRMLAWTKAEPASNSDAYLLRDFYCKDIQVADDLIDAVNDLIGGCVRRLCVNIATIIQESRKLGIDNMTKELWDNRPLFTGSPRPRRT